MSSPWKKIPILKSVIFHYEKIKIREIEKVNMLKNINNNISILINKYSIELNNTKYPLKVDYPPLLHNIELTNKCPMHCVACPRPYDMKRALGFMDITVFKKIVDELKILHPFPSKDDINLHHFGESLLHPQFDEAMQYICTAGFNGCLSCNPLFLNKEHAERLFSAHPGKIYMMMDGFDNESFFMIRGRKNAYDISLKNCLYAIEVRNKISPNTEILITSIDIPHFKKQIDKIEKFWKELYGITLYRKPYSTWNGTNENILELADDSEQPVEDVCYAPWHVMSITWDGLVVPCCMDYNNFYILGDIKKQSLAQIWNSDAMQAFRAEMRTKNIRNALCYKCKRINHVR